MPSQHLRYGFWDEWTNPQKVTFDGPNSLILVNTGVTTLQVETDLYSDWKEWATLYDHGKYLPAFRSVGGDPTSGGRALGATFFLTNGWRVKTWEGDHRLTVEGNLFTEEGEPPFVPVEGPYTTIIESSVSNLIDGLPRLAETATQGSVDSLSTAVSALGTQAYMQSQFDALATSLSGIDPPTALEIAQQVWAAPDALRLEVAAKVLQNRTVTDPNTGQMIVYDDDDVTPLLVANIFEDATGTQAYRGQGVEFRDRLA